MMRYGFFDSQITGYDQNNMPIFDRAENAEFFSKFMASFMTSGIYPTPTFGFEVTPDNGMTLQVSPGICCLQGRFAWLDEADTVTISAADQSAVRYDRVVIRLDWANRLIKLFVKPGTAGSGSPPTVTRSTTTYWELGLAIVKVNAGATSITSGNITDTRANTSVCGNVYSLGTVGVARGTLSLGTTWTGSAAPYTKSVTNIQSIPGITPTANILVGADPSCQDEWWECGVHCSAQGDRSLEFTALYDKPSTTLTAVVMVLSA